LIEVTQSLGQFLSLDKLLPQVLESLFKMLPQSQRGCIILKDSDGELKPGWVKVRKGELRVSRAVINKVMQSGDAIVTSNASTDSRFSTSQSLADFRLKSVMCAPLIDRNGNALGVVQLDTSNGRRAFGQEDLRVLVAMATQTSLAITVANLHETELRTRTLERDLMLAAEVQRNSLPEHRPSVSGYEFSDYYEPAEQVGGDFYDYIPLPDGRIGIVIGDVVGHGVPAALVMSKVLAETRFLAASLQDPATVIDVLNGITCRSTRLGRFITLLMVVLDPREHLVTLASAGHVPPVLRRADGSIDLPGRAGFGPPLGTSKKTVYQSHSFQMELGELLFLYTDGVSEAENAAAEAFGDSHVASLVSRGLTPTDVVTNVVDQLETFINETQQQDDLCIVCFGRQ
ncbi:MAG TPA: SpoIIE family protein phosphatase, partial [Pirellulaceae bacterium]|nr:SpoIIE family protein phosphatase [Pirellulaceae bacterium]